MTAWARRLASAIVTFVAIDLASVLAFAAPAAVPAGTDDIRDIRGPIAIPPWWRWPLVIALAAAAALAVVLLVRWWRARSARALSPLERARLALETAEAHAREGRAHEWADVVAETTRGALAARLGAAILPLTTSELAKGEWTHPPMSDEVDAPRVLGLLETCDLARFAQGAYRRARSARSDRSRARVDRAAVRSAPQETRGRVVARSAHGDAMMTLLHSAMHFQHPRALLLLVPLALVALWLGRRGRASAVAYSSTELVRAIAKTRRTQWGRLLPVLQWLGAALLVVALARPTIDHRNVKVEASGVDIMLAVDVSGSMQARDMAAEAPGAPPISRLDAAKEVVSRFVEARPNDRIGLVEFAGEPYLASPLTFDHDWVLQNVARLDPSDLGDGTAIGSAIASGVRRLDAQAAKSKILIVLTDGQSNAGKIQPSVAAEAAKALGVKVYTIGVGSTGDALVPVTDAQGREQLVKARVDVDEAGMKAVADATGGKFYRATDTHSLSAVYGDIDRMEKTTRTITTQTKHDERFAWFAMPGLFLVAAQLGLSATRFRRVP